MGYACPVCGDPQADARHLANHLAFTAMLGREDHERWLAEHAPGWADEGERELAGRVAEHAEETDYPQVFEDTTGRRESDADDERGERSGALFADEEYDGEHDHLYDDHGDGHDRHGGNGEDHPGHARGPAPHDRASDGPASHGHEVADVPRDPETESILDEARELTRQMLADEGTDDAPEEGGAVDPRCDDSDSGDDPGSDDPSGDDLNGSDPRQ